MDLTIAPDGTITVTLSRRNLVDLLVAVDSRPTHARLVRAVAGPTSRVLYVQAEPDVQHYAGRTAGPGINYSSERRYTDQPRGRPPLNLD